MVFLALEPLAATDAIRLAQQIGCAVWVGSDAISEDEHKRLVEAGTNVTRFAHPLAAASISAVEDAVATVVEHHPKDVIWVQHSFTGD